jgi:hypothetical protein
MKKNKSATEADPWRLAAVLLYARGGAATAYAQTRRMEAIASSDLDRARYWSHVQEAILTMLPMSAASGQRLN